MIQTPEDVQVGAAIGSIFFMLQNNNIPWWKRILFCIIGFGASSLTTCALVEYFHLTPGTSGGIGFFVAVTVIPIANSCIAFATNPSSFIDLLHKITGKGGTP